MSRLYPAIKHSDTNTNLDSYISKNQKKRPDKPKPTRDRFSKTSNPIQVNRLINQKNLVPLQKTNEKGHYSDQELVHKEVLNNNMAQVEVTVRTVSANSRSRTNSENTNTDKREPWGKLLQQKRSNDAISSYSYDYGLGTIHYLSKELQQKLESICPEHTNVQEIVNDIQRTLYRINPSILVDENLINPKDQIGDCNVNSKFKKEGEKAKSIKVKSVQTINSVDTKNDVQKQEYDIEKYVNIIKNLESTINTIKMEQQQLERKLQEEKEVFKKITLDMNEKFKEKDEHSKSIIEGLNKEIEDLKKQLHETKNVNKPELNDMVQNLKTDNTSIEYENMNLKHEQIVMKLEKEKLLFLLDSRDKQIKSLKHEIETIQSLVCSQIFDFKTCFSPLPSRSILGSGKIKHEIHMSDTKSDFSRNLFEVPSSNSLFRRDTTSTMKSEGTDEFPQRDVPAANDVMPRENATANPSSSTFVSELQDLIKDDLEDNIKEMFEKLKKQALVCSSSLQPNHLVETGSVDNNAM